MENDELTMNVITTINEWLPETTEAHPTRRKYMLLLWIIPAFCI